MIDVLTTQEFESWLRRLRDERARRRVYVRIRRLQTGNPGDSRSLGGALVEMRIRYGPGYRVYYTWRDRHTAMLLAGGDKTTQVQDIARAKEIERGL